MLSDLDRADCALQTGMHLPYDGDTKKQLGKPAQKLVLDFDKSLIWRKWGGNIFTRELVFILTRVSDRKNILAIGG